MCGGLLPSSARLIPGPGCLGDEQTVPVRSTSPLLNLSQA